MQKIINELKLTSTGFLEFIVLKMLYGEQTFTPLEIYNELRNVGFKTPMGSIYPLLTKFRRKKFVVSGYEQGDNGFAIKTYYLADTGREYLINLRRDWKRLNQLIASMGIK
jgi:DNA-binding PadR family transcriptional regulator